MVTDAIPDEIMREATLVAVDMEIHAALSTTTRAKAEVIARALMARKRDAQMTDALLTAEARVRELEQKLERARLALEPFAREGSKLTPDLDKYSWLNTGLSNANFRHARAALAEIGQRG